MKSEIASIRREFLLGSLSENEVNENPVIQFQEWFQQAIDASVEDANAMTLSTVDENNTPKSRIVLLKGIEEDQFVFFTNYHSHKGHEIAHNPNIALSFYWKELQRQVRIEGKAIKTSEENSVNYFMTRPVESQLGAWASYQSEVLDSRATLEARFQELKKKYNNMPVPKPPHWGGYAVTPVYIEFWQGGANRLHDRISYQKQADGVWEIKRLNP